MLYRINQSITYTPDDGTISLINHNGTSSGEIFLAPTANRLLHILISHQGSILQRDELLDKVWDAHGLKASNNSLNQYISVLRRNFADLGLEEAIIVTIPTVGFMFSKEISVIAEQNDISTESHSNNSVPSLPATAQQAVEASLSAATVIHRHWLQGGIAALIMLLTLANISFFYSAKNMHPQFQKRYLLNTADSCPIYSFYSAATANPKDLTELALKALKKSGLDCTSGNDIYFEIEDQALYHEKAAAFIAVCNQWENNTYSHCRSYYTN